MPRTAKEEVQSGTKEDILGDASEYVLIDWFEGKEKEIVNPKVPGSFEKAVRSAGSCNQQVRESRDIRPSEVVVVRLSKMETHFSMRLK
ncbi:hypothetical protein BTUL_0038g00320 [Botrytis tulipae]|uniref:Uncharacterized protein n=1 Tax=Botrytis tulipae TaxID=87230 RepID=A0A4Z1EXJ2_9HELO|nr:hypothetical protein BTUL_0038g00320 [Botrytis tulipae]